MKKREIMSLNCQEKAKRLIENNEGYARTGCTLLDCVVGGGIGLGFPFGRILNFVGDKSSGKTFLANEIIAYNHNKYKKNLKFNYDDAEAGFTFDTENMYGVNIIDENTTFSSTVEELDVNVYDFIKKIRNDKQVGIYVVDSLDGLCNSEVKERESERAKEFKKAKEKDIDYKDKGTYGMKSQKFLSQEFFRLKSDKLKDKKILLIFISQIRDKIDAKMFQRKWTRAGGRALDFYVHSIIVLAQIHKIKKEDKTIGVVIKAMTDKSKTARPHRECVFSLYFDYGIDDVGSNLDYLFDLRAENGKLLKAAQAINFDGVSKNIKTYKEFLINNNLYEKAKEIKKEETGRSNLTVEWLDEWIEKDKKISKLSEDYFGESFTRDELIQRAENDAEFKKEIELRTVTKWEEAEERICTKRKKKYE